MSLVSYVLHYSWYCSLLHILKPSTYSHIRGVTSRFRSVNGASGFCFATGLANLLLLILLWLGILIDQTLYSFGILIDQTLYSFGTLIDQSLYSFGTLIDQALYSFGTLIDWILYHLAPSLTEPCINLAPSSTKACIHLAPSLTKPFIHLAPSLTESCIIWHLIDWTLYSFFPSSTKACIHLAPSSTKPCILRLSRRVGFGINLERHKMLLVQPDCLIECKCSYYWHLNGIYFSLNYSAV